MNIKLSKNQWEKIGNKAGWMKKEAAQPGKKIKELPAKVEVWSGVGKGSRFQLIVDNEIQIWTDELPALHEALKVLIERKYSNLLQPQQPQQPQPQPQPQV